MRLVEFGVFPTEGEMVMWQANCDTITQQLELRFGKSAEDLIKDSVLVEILTTVVERMPRTSDIFRTAAILSNQSFINSKTTILNGILKICQNLTKSIWKNGGIFNKTFFLEMITLFDHSTNEKDDAGQIFEKFLNRQLISKADVVKYIDSSGKQCLDELIEFGQSIKSEYEADRNDETAMNIVEYLVTIGSLIVDLNNISEFVQKHHIKVDKKWVNRIPDVFEFLYTNFDYPTLFEIASNIDGFPLRKVFEARSFALQRLVECYDSTIGQNSKIFTAYSIAMRNKEDAFCEEVRMKSVERMRKCGYFENLGISDDEEIQGQISYVSEMWPNLSPQYIHLILRHFSYNAELAVSNLCTNEGIPIELKFVESNTDWSYDTDNFDWPPLDFTASDEIERALYADIKRRKESEAAAAAASKKPGLFSLAHNNSKPDVVDNSPEQEMSAIRRKAEEYKANVFAKLNKIRAPPPPIEGENEEEVLIPMTNSKIYSALNNLKLTAPEMVAIRPTYDKYKYETPNDDGMYDDEYDDEYEARVFNIERLNEELESSSDEEVNTEQASIPSSSRGGHRGGRGGNRQPPGLSKGPAPPPGLANGGASTRGSSDYTGGRNRQLKERHKSDQKQRGADRKHRGVGY